MLRNLSQTQTPVIKVQGKHYGKCLTVSPLKTCPCGKAVITFLAKESLPKTAAAFTETIFDHKITQTTKRTLGNVLAHFLDANLKVLKRKVITYSVDVLAFLPMPFEILTRAYPSFPVPSYFVLDFGLGLGFDNKC
jgi:hypothetical protein